MGGRGRRGARAVPGAFAAAASLAVALLAAGALPARAALADDVWPAGTYPSWATEACPAGGAHVFTSEVLSEPGEEADGVRLYACTKCGQAFEEAIPHTGHDWGPWVVDVAPTCVSAGSEHRECRRFEARGQVHYEYREIPALSSTGEHTWGGWVVDSEPSADEDGSEHRVCSVCGAVETRAIPATGEAAEPDSGEATTEAPTTEAPAVGPETATTPEPGTGPAASDAPTVETAPEPADEGPATLGPLVLTLEPNEADAALARCDAAVALVVAALLAPTAAPLLWLARRRRLARREIAPDPSDEAPGFRVSGPGAPGEGREAR